MFSMVNMLFDMDLCVFQSGFPFAVSFYGEWETDGGSKQRFSVRCTSDD